MPKTVYHREVTSSDTLDNCCFCSFLANLILLCLQTPMYLNCFCYEFNGQLRGCFCLVGGEALAANGRALVALASEQSQK